METIKEAIEEITFKSKKFPKEAFRIISEHKEEAIPYLYEAIDRAVNERNDLDENYELHFYALFLLGEFQDKNSFEKIMALVLLPSEELDSLLGDAITSGLSDILYNTYNGNWELLKNAVWNIEMNDFAKSAIVKVMGQLYLDNVLPKEEWQSLIKKIVYSETDIGDYVYTELVSVICQCHMVDMLPEIRCLYEKNFIDEMCMGQYDSCVDYMFQYLDNRQNICKKPMNAAKCLKNWAMFEDDRQVEAQDREGFEKIIKEMKKGQNKVGKKVKIGRNDPCPCGSGRKYKQCCMNKPQQGTDLIESEQERKKWLKNYPEVGKERQEGRVYLEDYYDAESIEIDQLLYLALKRRARPVWEPVRQEDTEKRMRLYLWNAFEKLREKVEKEKISTLDEYDKKYAIHYQCRVWVRFLMQLLEKNGDSDMYSEVEDVWEKMSVEN